ncbi:MAG: heme exporter protein CcmD [Pyrinomonadaceae bacterium]|nr:heme exporter protein CcmD [Pyrinomonadaceae bacterium]
MNWSEFFSMGGYAFYVWGSYLATLILMGGEVVVLLRRRKLSDQQKRSTSVVQGKVITNETTS